MARSGYQLCLLNTCPHDMTRLPISRDELAWWTRRLSVRLLKIVAVDRMRRLRASLVSALTRIPLLKRIGRFVLTDTVSLTQAGSSESHWVSEFKVVSPGCTMHITDDHHLALLQLRDRFRDSMFAIPTLYH